MTSLKRNRHCGDLSAADQGREVVLAGWVQRRRDHGGLIFIDLRDRSGIAQVVFSPEVSAEGHALAHELRSEYVIAARGTVRRRPAGMENPKIPTGEVEVYADRLEILNRSETPPFPVEERVEVSEGIRLKYRYLDLRRPPMQRALLMRHRLTRAARGYLDEQGFVEVETPFLTKSTPEGARDYLVPSRVNPGRFYALPQSPQLFKQILMAAGLERYYQIARCFRDEDLRADRQPEFTQIDMELSFVDEEDVLGVTEGLVARIFAEVRGLDLPTPFPRLPYREALDRFGLDKPDTRFGLELTDVSDLAAQSRFQVFTGAVASGGTVRGMRLPGCAALSRKEIDDLTEAVKVYGAKGLAWFKAAGGKLESSIAKFFDASLLEALRGRMSAADGDLLVFVADAEAVALESLGNLRNLMGRRLGMIDEGRFDFVWVTEFPLLEWDADRKRYAAMHHPFTAPAEEDLALLDTAPDRVRARAYDLVLNGSEIGGGSIRIHRPDVQERMLRALGMEPGEARERFGFLLEALSYGTPPHGGIALGLDRLAAILAGVSSIRDVIAFPKTQKAVCPMTGAPARVDAEQLRELMIRSEVVDS